MKRNGQKSVWQLQEAKNRLSELVERARTVGAQTITRHGKPVVVVVSQEAFAMLKPAKKRSLVELLRACPAPLSVLNLKRNPEKVRSIRLG